MLLWIGEMTTRFWIKLYIGMLDDPRMARLPNHLWRRAVELFLLAGREGNDGALPPVEEMAWILRLSDEKVLEDLHGLAEVGVVYLAEPMKWMVTDFAKWQTAIPVEERVRQYRERNGGAIVTKDAAYGHCVTKRYKRCNEVEEDPSTSTYSSFSESDSESESNSDFESDSKSLEEEGKTTPSAPYGGTSPIFPQRTGTGKNRNGGGRAAAPFGGTSPNAEMGEEPPPPSPYGYYAAPPPFPPKERGQAKTEMGEGFLPRTPKEALAHPDLQVFAEVTGGRIPGMTQYQTVIEAIRLLRAREKLDKAELRETLVPYWLAWSGRKRRDGRPYDPANLTWLTEWALNGTIPPASGSNGPESGRPAVPSPEETRRMLAEKDQILKQAVPMPEELRAKIRGLALKKAGKEPP